MNFAQISNRFRSDCEKEHKGVTNKGAGWEIPTYVLIGSHYHLLLRTPEASLVRKDLRTLGIRQNGLDGMKKGAVEKGLIARKIRREMSASASWIAAQLEMGVPSVLSRIVAATEAGLLADRDLRRLEKKMND